MTSRAPQDYTFVVPADWWRVDLSSVTARDASVKALADRQFRGYDDRPQLKREFVEEMRARCREAADAGASELYLSLASVGPVPLAASLVVTLAPAPADSVLQALADEGERAGEEVAAVELAGGPAVRTRTGSRPFSGSLLGGEPDLKTTTVRYGVPVPGVSAVLLLAFSTPLDAVTEEMTALFDAVASSLRWVW
jgi:hypothetical protein